MLEYLLFAGDDRYGALGVSLSAQAYQPWPSAAMPSLATLQEIADVVRKVLANEPVPEVQRRLVRPGVSLGGARPKSVVSIDGEPWLVKFSEGDALDMQLIEHATMTLAAQCGIDVAATKALKLASGHAVAIRRFDRAGNARIQTPTTTRRTMPCCGRRMARTGSRRPSTSRPPPRGWATRP